MRFRFWLAVVGFSTLLAAPAFAQEEMPEECAGFATYDECLAALQAGAPVEEPVPAPEEPVYQEPAPEEPVYEEPAPEEPVYQEPAPEEPVYQEPAPEEPIYDEPAPEEPVYEEPAPEEPVYQEPAPEEPIYDEPAPEEPVYEEPAPEEPVYDEPAAEEPVYDEPTPQEPVYDEPTPDEPVYDEPVPETSVDEATPDDTTAVENDPTQEDPVAEPETTEVETAVEPDTTGEDTAVEPETTNDEPAVTPDTTDEDTAVEPDASQEQTDVTADRPADPDLVVEDDTDVEPMATEALIEDDPIADLPPEELSTATEPVTEGASAGTSAPLTDSGKEDRVEIEADTGEDVEAPKTNEEAQVKVEATPEQIVEANAVTGEVMAAAPPLVTPDNATIINNVQNTYIYQTNNTVIINNSYADRDRIFGGDDNYQFDQIGDSRFRETVYRDDGSVVVTTRDQYGNILERYRTDPYGDTYVLAYFDPAYYDDMDYWGDPGIDLPPLRITISIRDYALDWRYADADAIASFFAEPPLERARRIYSIDEVKRSARLRDSLRRLEVNDLNFASGSANLSRSQVNGLSRLAEAMWTLLEQNPAETFLIEGHTDAKGSDRANLILSDQRASNVARILTQYYDIPPENLATQGYGERYLRIRTPRAEAQNRRVTIRRITPLVTPYFANR
jgi:outer membrane protein OmpA-like peptidoglycan-associated protein